MALKLFNVEVKLCRFCLHENHLSSALVINCTFNTVKRNLRSSSSLSTVLLTSQYEYLTFENVFRRQCYLRRNSDLPFYFEAYIKIITLGTILTFNLFTYVLSMTSWQCFIIFQIFWSTQGRRCTLQWGDRWQLTILAKVKYLI